MRFFKEFNEYEQLLIGLRGLIQFIESTSKDSIKYIKYKCNDTESFNDETLKEMEILSLLDKLGFDMNERGTYLYKNIIFKLLSYIENEQYNNNLYKELLKKVKNPYSNLYLELARYDLDMGINTFHTYIINALNKVNYEKSDPTLLFQIFSKKRELDYGEQALLISLYISNNLEPRRFIPKIKKLTNLNNMELKDNF